eukprot:14340993-Alexandrium_andersonii.AAC.1
MPEPEWQGRHSELESRAPGGGDARRVRCAPEWRRLALSPMAPGVRGRPPPRGGDEAAPFAR